MKTFRSTSKFIGLGSLLALAFSFTAAMAFAGTNPQFTTKPGTMAKSSDPAKPNAPAAMACPVCKTVPLVRAAIGTIQDSRAQPRPPEVGFKHSCGHCGGELTAMRGKMTNAMQGNCVMCGKNAERCVAAQHPAKTA